MAILQKDLGTCIRKGQMKVLITSGTKGYFDEDESYSTLRQAHNEFIGHLRTYLSEHVDAPYSFDLSGK